MDESKFIPLSTEEFCHIDSRISELRRWYGALDLAPCSASNFEGDFRDITALDYIFYELGAHSWAWDDGQTHAFAWGNVLVRQLGFRWVKLPTDTSPRHFAVRHGAVPCIVFPWPRLFELVE